MQEIKSAEAHYFFHFLELFLFSILIIPFCASTSTKSPSFKTFVAVFVPTTHGLSISLEIGSTTAGPLTKKAKIHRSRVYGALNRLIEKGLVSYVIKANRKYFRAQNPETLVSFIEEKKQKIKTIIPELKILQKEKTEKQEATVFEGYKCLKSVFDNAINQLSKRDEILVFGARSGQDTSPQTWDSFFSNFNQRRIEKGIKYKIIFNQDIKNSKVVREFSKSKLMEVRFIDQKTPAGINVHGDKVAVIVWKKKSYTFLITSKEVANSFREYFKIMWNLSKK